MTQSGEIATTVETARGREFPYGYSEAIATTETVIEYPESDGEPMAETDVHYQQMTALRFALERHFEDEPMVYVGANLFVYYVEGEPRENVAPDVFVAFGVPKGNRRTYKVWEEGAAPTVVFELTSPETRRDDQYRKRWLYESLGVQEYFLYDPLHEYLHPPLQGYRLKQGRYERLEPRRTETGEWELQSEVLELTLRTQDQTLYLYDPRTAQKLLTPEETAYARREAEARAAQEITARREAEARIAQEITARREAETRIAELEVELARLRAALAQREATEIHVGE